MSAVIISFGPVLDGNDRYIPRLAKIKYHLCAFSDDKSKIDESPESCQIGMYHHYIKEDDSRHLRFVMESNTGEHKFRFMRVVDHIEEYQGEQV